MKPLIGLLLAVGLLPLALAAAPQTQTPQPPATDIVSVPPFGVLTISGRSFSAVAEMDRTLVSGVKSQTRTKVLIYRDSYGRICYETYLPTSMDKEAPAAPNWVQIHDPVAKVTYFLLERSHIALRTTFAEIAKNSPSPSSAPEPSFRFEQLGTQDILGFVVTGTRDTRQFPGNPDGTNQTVSVSEVWRSAELGIDLLTKSSKSGYGKLEKRVISIEQGEPNATLFRPPPDYTVEEQRPHPPQSAAKPPSQ